MPTLEELSPEQFARVAQWLSDPEINRWLTPEWRRSETSPSMIALAVRSRRNLLFLVRYEGEPCGLVVLSDIDTVDRTAMIWYLLGVRRLGGKGITAAAVRQLVCLAFERLGLASVYAWAMDDNAVSKRLLLRVGFREAGRLRQSAWSAGRQVDRVYFDMVSGEAPLGSDFAADAGTH
jgi:RimJ/RimL family protein N-acetyltransferase